jgi:hypothetical protein
VDFDELKEAIGAELENAKAAGIIVAWASATPRWKRS